ncbi:hypothetical protein IWX85_002172 [Polaromonas sp. CG_9.11]|nr:hypothetical protein [Polaromonas sp. CG_9.11]
MGGSPQPAANDEVAQIGGCGWAHEGFTDKRFFMRDSSTG